MGASEFSLKVLSTCWLLRLSTMFGMRWAQIRYMFKFTYGWVVNSKISRKLSLRGHDGYNRGLANETEKAQELNNSKRLLRLTQDNRCQLTHFMSAIKSCSPSYRPLLSMGDARTQKWERRGEMKIFRSFQDRKRSTKVSSYFNFHKVQHVLLLLLMQHMTTIHNMGQKEENLLKTYAKFQEDLTSPTHQKFPRKFQTCPFFFIVWNFSMNPADSASIQVHDLSFMKEQRVFILDYIMLSFCYLSTHASSSSSSLLSSLVDSKLLLSYERQQNSRGIKIKCKLNPTRMFFQR